MYPVGYNVLMKNTILETNEFSEWLKALRNPVAKARILARITNAANGNFGVVEPVGNGVSEMKINTGPGYRIYYVKKGVRIFILLCGGDKSTQQKDIDRAKEILKILEEERGDS